MGGSKENHPAARKPPGGDDDDDGVDVPSEKKGQLPISCSVEEAAYFSDHDDDDHAEGSSGPGDADENGGASGSGGGAEAGGSSNGSKSLIRDPTSAGGARGIIYSENDGGDEGSGSVTITTAATPPATSHGKGPAGAENACSSKQTSSEVNSEPCEKCTELFYAELDKSMKATAKAYFGWVSRILSSAPLVHQKHWWQKSLACTPGEGGGRGGSGGGSGAAGGGGGSTRGGCPPSTSSFLKAFGAAGAKLARNGDRDAAPDLSGVGIDVHTEAKECLHWIELNSTALRKILKKWDKTNHSTKGRKTLRKYWSDSQYQMLYSPLILELRAVAGMLHGGNEGPHWEEDELHFGCVGGGTLGNDSSENLGGAAAASHLSEILKCGICLDTLYKPVGLACGHVFCRDCLLQTAGILKEGATFADLRADPTMVHDDVEEEEEEDGGGGLHAGTGVLPRAAEAVQEGGRSGPSAGPPQPPPRPRKHHVRKDRCPECRQDNVFATSVRLQHVQECLRRVDPEGYSLRKAESRKFRGKLELDATMEHVIKMLLSLATPTGMQR